MKEQDFFEYLCGVKERKPFDFINDRMTNKLNMWIGLSIIVLTIVGICIN